MIKRIKKIGNGNALFLDRAILELIGLEDGGEVQLTVNAGRITIVPVNPHPVSTERFESALERVVKERRDVLRRLAE